MLHLWGQSGPIVMPYWQQRLVEWASFWRWRVESIEMFDQRFGYQPVRFFWRGRTYQVYAIDRVWERPPRRHQNARRYFTVRCRNGGRYTIFQDLRVGVWSFVWRGFAGA